MTTTAEILQKARDLISDEKNWTREELARDAKGYRVSPYDDNAVCFCALGSVSKASSNIENAQEEDAIEALREVSPTIFIAAFNDSHTHAEVLDLFDRAIRRAISVEGKE